MGTRLGKVFEIPTATLENVARRGDLTTSPRTIHSWTKREIGESGRAARVIAKTLIHDFTSSSTTRSLYL
jgi:hypothetical protein